MDQPDLDAVRKQELRRVLLARRRARGAQERAAAGRANADHLTAALTGSGVVCAFLPLPTEPLSGDLLDQLVVTGWTVLVPVVRADRPLDWCTHPASTEAGAFGIREPIGDRLGVAAIRTADVLLVPATAVDPAGHRLGRGGGHYDRSLALLSVEGGATSTSAGPSGAGPRIIAVLFDDELVPLVPADDYDRPVTATVTPTGGVVDLGR